MSLKIITGSFLSVVGFLAAILGILFIIASKGDTGSRLTSGLILFILGLSFFIIGAVIFKKAIQMTPASIKKKLLKLARENHGEVSEDAILGELGNSEDVHTLINELVAVGTAKEKIRDNRKFLFFPDFFMEMMVKQCPYCGNDYPVRDDIELCPNCGGDLKMYKSRLANKEDSFSMDDDDSNLS